MKKSQMLLTTLLLFVSYFLAVGFSQSETKDLGKSVFHEGDKATLNAEEELGRLLFYDKRLSSNGRVACATCHQQQHAFADVAALSNLGVSHRRLSRNTPGLINAGYGKAFFWDGGAFSLKTQVYGPLTNPDEMDSDLTEALVRLNNIPFYKKQFKKVMHSSISSESVAKAIAAFEKRLISFSSRYDKYLRHEPGAYLTSSEKRGKLLIHIYCGSCHSGILFTDDKFHNNGLDESFDVDTLEGIYQGRFRITSDSLDLGKFKTPTLRNICLTAPYMHDGRYRTLEQVFRHYGKDIKRSKTLDSALAHYLTGGGLNITCKEKRDMLSFLFTLTDTSFIRDKRFADPFRK